MKKILTAAFLLLNVPLMAQSFTVLSPDNRIRLDVVLDGDGALRYEVSLKGAKAILPSALGIVFKEPAVRLDRFMLISMDTSFHDAAWKPVYGEYETIRDVHRELNLSLQQRGGEGIRLHIIFRVFNEGVGFRYAFPAQQGLSHFIVADELSQFRLDGDADTFWIPGDYDSNEFTYSKTRLSGIDARISKNFTSIFAKTFFHEHAVQTPLMMKTPGGLYVNIHEAALVNYPAMNLVLDKGTFTFTSHLVPDAVGNKAYLQAPAATPWRTIIVTDKATEIIPANRMILNLNEPSKIGDTSFIRPQKFAGVWWEMHVGTGSWDYAATQSGAALVPHGRHSANTRNVKRYIDFAGENGLDGVLVEGWNVGWEDWFGKWKENVFDFITPYPDYDIRELQQYAKEKGVRLIMHHETSASVTNYERQLDTAFRFMINHGMNTVKTGYVGYIIPRGEHHDGQWMVNHYRRVAEKAAGYGIMIDAHEPVRPTGLHRTYPNWMTSEAARGNEFNAWSEGNPPEHETILPFTRLMGGPMDYTPGIFQLTMNAYDSSKKFRVHTTLAKQLALYVTMYSPLQMVADLPENYLAKPDAFQFIRDVAVDWSDTRVLLAEPGDYLLMARQAKGTGNWFVGGITDETRRVMVGRFSFLEPGKKYLASIYRDADGAHWEQNPHAYVVEHFIVDALTMFRMKLAAGGGIAVSLRPATAAEIKKHKKYNVAVSSNIPFLMF